MIFYSTVLIYTIIFIIYVSVKTYKVKISLDRAKHTEDMLKGLQEDIIKAKGRQ